VNPQYEAHERFCKSIGDMAKENEQLKDRIKQLEESLESANTLLQLVMCEQNHLRDVRNKANERIKRLEEFVNRFFDPEDLGYVVSTVVRDDAREAIGMKRVESGSRVSMI
jgi:predicted nuclease with TOPRIM domain